MGIRKFNTGATRDTNEGKPSYKGFLSPLTIKRLRNKISLPLYPYNIKRSGY